jgi:four helix bundle protein
LQDFRNLKVWQKAHQLTLGVYRVSKSFPKEELFALTQQVRRSAQSIPTNIAEGCGRGSNADFARFLWIANGSAKEVD